MIYIYIIYNLELYDMYIKVSTRFMRVFAIYVFANTEWNL